MDPPASANWETEQRIYLMNVWREPGNKFTEEEKLLLAMTEEITLIFKKGFYEELYIKTSVYLEKKKQGS